MRLLLIPAFIIILISCNNKKDKETEKTDTVVTDTASKIPPKGVADLSNKFLVDYAPYTDTTLMLEDVHFAVIPLDRIGLDSIPWHGMMKDFTKESDKEFETEMMQCIDGKDKSPDAYAVTSKRPHYCEREGYSDNGGMGSYPILYYAGFVKDNNLVIAEFFNSYSKCSIGYETKKEQQDCEARNETERNAVRAFMDHVVETIAISKK